MAEPLPQKPNLTAAEALTGKAESLIIGETPLYLSSPVRMGNEDMTSLTILSADKRANDGVGSAIPLVREASRKKGEEGMMVDKPLTNLNDFDEVPWEKISGVQWTDESGTTHVIPKDEITLTPPEPVASENLGISDLSDLSTLSKKPEEKLQLLEKPPILPAKEARGVLETLTEDPNTITIVGLKAYETRALDLADRSMQRKLTGRSAERADATRSLWEKTKDATHGLHELIFTTIWKQSIGGIYFRERARQYYLEMLKTAETPFAEDAIKLAEARAKLAYEKKLGDANFVVRIGTRAVDYLKDKLGMKTTVQRLALEELGAMKASGEIRGMETFEREAKAVRARFSQDMDKADQFVRAQLGEKLEILDPENAEHKPLVEGIQSLLKQYASGEIADKETFDAKTKEFFAATLKNVRPDIFAEAELYSSSLFDAAETLRTKMSHEAGLTNIDEAISSMHIRLGLGQMGEVTSMDPTAVEKGVAKIRDIFEWLNKKNVLVPAVFNEAAIGTGVAIALSAANFVKTVPFGRLIPLGGGAIAGGLFAGWREYGQLHQDYLTHLREKESGASFTEMQKRRSWFEKFAVKQRDASDMITSIQSGMESGNYRSVMATIADLQARKAVSETGPKRIGLIRYSNREAIESERAALDIAASKALGDLNAFGDLGGLLGGTSLPDFMEKLTVTQTRVLRDGVRVLETQEDPVKATLSLISSYAPEADIIKRRWPLASSDEAYALSASIQGLDAIMEEFKKEARTEAVKYGVKAGAFAAALGGVVHGLREIRSDGLFDNADGVFDKAGDQTVHVDPMTASADRTVMIGKDVYQFPPNVDISQNGDGTFAASIEAGGRDIVLGENIKSDELLETLRDAGFSTDAPHGVVPSRTTDSVIPDLFTKNHDPITAQLPPGWRFDHVTPTGHPDSWSILDAGGKPVIEGIHFNPDGSVADLDGLKQQVADHGLDFDTKKITISHTETAAPAAPEVTPVAPAGETMTITAKDFGNGGLWDYFLDRAHAMDPDNANTMATGNGLKNLFRMYTYDQANGNIEVPDTHGADYELPLRHTVYGTTPVEEFDIARIPPDATIRVPEHVFNDQGIAWFAEQNDTAVKHLNEIIAAGSYDGEAIRGPMDAINKLYESDNAADHMQGIILKLGYVGNDDKLPTTEDIRFLMGEMEKLSVTHPTGTTPVPTTPDIVPKSPETFATFTQLRIAPFPGPAEDGKIFAANGLDIPYTLAETIAVPANTAPERPWYPIFIPYRQVLEAQGDEPEPVKPDTKDRMLSPFGMEDMYLSSDAIKERLSPRLTEKPDAVLSQSEEIGWYLSTLAPDDVQTLDALSLQENPAITPEVRAVVTIPAQATGGMYQRLTRYVGQTAADGSPLDPKKTEFIVFDTRVAPPEGSVTPSLPADSKADVDRFIAEHPEIRVIYVSHTYPEAPTSGRVKRDLSNFALSRIATLPADSPDVALIADNGTTGPVDPTAIASVIDTLDANPGVDLVSGSYELPHEAYEQFPLLFAQHRAFELMDALVRHGDAGSVPGVYSGNVGVRSATLAAVGGYNPDAAIAEDRELAWVVGSARGNAESMMQLPVLTATIDPKETVYSHLQRLGMAEPTVPLSQNEVYKDMTWQDMAKKASEGYTKEQLEAHLSNMYTHMYPGLKENNPARFDAYFKRTMDALGLPYEITDGNVTIQSVDNLSSNMSAPLNIESFARESAPAVVEATPTQVETSREALSTLAGEQPQEIPQEPTESIPTGISSPEVTSPTEPVTQVSSNISDLSTLSDLGDQSEKPKETLTPPESSPPVPEVLPEGVEDRINYVLGKSSEPTAGVALSPGELMDYVKTAVEIPMARITDGKIEIDGNTVKLTDMKARTVVGEAQFDGTLLTDPDHGLVVNKESLNLKLPMLARPWQKSIHDSLDHFNDLVLTHLNGKIDPTWKAERIDIVDEKLEVTFAKKTDA